MENCPWQMMICLWENGYSLCDSRYTLFLDAAPTDEIRAAALAQLITAVKKTENHPTTGIIGTKWLPEALSKLRRRQCEESPVVLGFNQDLEKVLKALVNQWFRWFPQRA